MALILDQMQVKTIVDRVSEWGEDGKERPLNPIRRGIIVRVDGDPGQEQVDGIYVCFGPSEGETEVKVGDVVVKATKTKAAELIEAFPHDSSIARQAWNRLFKVPSQVGVVFENRKAKGSGKRRTQDALGLTPSRQQGPVTDDSAGDMP